MAAPFAPSNSFPSSLCTTSSTNSSILPSQSFAQFSRQSRFCFPIPSQQFTSCRKGTHIPMFVYEGSHATPSSSSEEEIRFVPPSNIAPSPPEREEWEEGNSQEELVANPGVIIRRRPPTGPPVHHVGPFQFRIQSEGNTPRNILEEIVWHKDIEVNQMKEKMSLISIKKALPAAPPARDFVAALRRRAEETGMPALIAEVKKASPSKGVIQPNFDPVCIAQSYAQGGAACLSVLTDAKYFQGSFEYLQAIRATDIECPLLCKEFIVDAWQIYFARLKGADAILLIAGILPDQDLRYMSKIGKLLGMAALIEVHNTKELDRVLEMEGVELIGINNRDLETFKVDVKNTVHLLQGDRGQRIRQSGIMVVGESGLFTSDDIALVQAAGVGAVLVGESLVKQNDPAAGIAALFGKDISQKSKAGTGVTV